jgi:calcineurin-like phosphoesterase family protein
MSNVFFISDTHFGHNNICTHRPSFSNVNEHDEFIFNNIMETITKRDTLWILGDVCFTMETFKKYVVPISEKVSVLRICLGNHDNERISAPTVADYVGIGADIYGITKYKNAWVTHAPLHPDELRNKINIHGHVHGHTLKDNRYVNVSCEAVNYRPIKFSTIIGRELREY